MGEAGMYVMRDQDDELLLIDKDHDGRFEEMENGGYQFPRCPWDSDQDGMIYLCLNKNPKKGKD